ncbi:unnamed protein product, partial [marine sediment metagenome]
AFDTLAWDYDKSVQNKGHFDRLQYAQTISDNMKTDLIYVNTKSFTTFETPSDFFRIMRDMFNQQLVLPYKQDGFMFTPQNTVYNPHSDKMPLYKRKLSDYPDICKWKPKDELTIDLQIKWKVGNILELYSNEKGNPVLFTKFDKIDSGNIMTLNLPSNTIVEYRYDYEKNMLVPTRIRFDKEKPNRRDVAEDVANDILNPIEEETMKGNNFTLLRKYHNLVKKNLFNSVKGRTLLDIGSGYGGDLGKWKGYEKIVAVEPDPEHIDELRKRLKTYNMEDKVKIVLAGGQETEKITVAVKEWIGDRVDTVSSMLSLTFFWQNPGLIDSLVQTIVRNIKPEGKYIFLTMDGDLVEQTFDPAFDTLAWDYDKSVQDKGHFDRLQYAQTISDNMKTDLIYVNTKSFTTFETPSEFFRVMRDMFNQQLVLPYKQDGFMFTPQNTVYNPHSDKMPLYKRKLSDYPDICKWKPKDELTIDLQIKWKVGNILELYSNEKGNPVLFTKFDKIDSGNIMTLNLPSNTIVEY